MPLQESRTFTITDYDPKAYPNKITPIDRPFEFRRQLRASRLNKYTPTPRPEPMLPADLLEGLIESI